jgi:hypothetical protein
MAEMFVYFVVAMKRVFNDPITEHIAVQGQKEEVQCLSPSKVILIK